MKYDLAVTLNPWMITLKRPLYEVGDLLFNLPPHLRDWEPRWHWFDFREQFELFQNRLGEFREFENMFTEGQLIKLRADIEIAAGNLEEGEALLNHSLEIFEHMGAASAVGDVFRSRANLFARSGNVGEAHELLRAAMEHHMETGNREGVLKDVRQLLTFSEEPESFIQAMDFVYEIYHQNLHEAGPALKMETTQLMTEMLLLNRNIEGALAAFILSERNGSNSDETAMQQLDEQEGKLLHLLGNQGYRELKSSLNHHPEGILEIETSQLLGAY